MDPKPLKQRMLYVSALTFVLVALLAVPGISATTSQEGQEAEEISEELRSAILDPVKERLLGIRDEKNAAGVKNKRGTYSTAVKKIDDETYRASMHVDTAEGNTLITKRYQIVIKKDPDKSDKWVVAEEVLKDTFAGLHRSEMGFNCYPFESFSFDREGLEISASNGGMCEWYYRGAISAFMLAGDDLRYDYQAPVQQNFYALNKFLLRDRTRELIFEPKRVSFPNCDPASCEELIESSFTGLSRVAREERTNAGTEVPASMPSNLKSWVDEQTTKKKKNRKEKPFSGFRPPPDYGHTYYNAWVVKNEDHAIGIEYDNWEGYEVHFWVFQRTTDRDAMRGRIFGYYTEETLKNTEPYALERRDDLRSRWYEVSSVVADVEAALVDPEVLEAKIDYVITSKQDNLTRLPFFIRGKPQGETASYKRPSLSVNSIQTDGEELTWVKTSPYGGIVVLPEPLNEGETLALHMAFKTRAIRKQNPAFSQLARFGWMPFVRFGDFIDNFEMTIKTPSQYKTLGIGEKVFEEKKGGVLTTKWYAESPVVFPTVIFGKYIEDTPRFEAKKADGRVIPVTVHVDEVSTGQIAIDLTSGQKFQDTVEAFRSGARGIRGKQLRSIAEQAANAINLYTEISGVDYPYGELNLVNDPAPALYGQAPSSLIYLGSFVFRGEGTMAGDSLGGFIGGGGTGTAKFLKSVVAHEVGHQWWGSRVSNSNTRNYWFVESLAEYFSAIYLESAFGKKEYQEQVDEWRRNVLRVDQRTSVQNAQTLWQGEFPGRARQAAIYSKGPYAFHILRETFGDDKFFQFLRSFTQELVEKREIVTLDIQKAAERGLGGVDADGKPYNVDLSWFFDQWIRGVGLPQYSFNYDVRQNEEGAWVVHCVIKQQVVIGNARDFEVLEDTYYRSVIDVTALGRKGKEYTRRVLVDGPETEFSLVVPEKPLEVHMNKDGEVLAHDILVNKPF